MRGGEAPEGMPTFRNYMEFPRRIPLAFWHVVRITSIVGYVTLCVAMFIRPAGALFTFFKVIVPLLPIPFFVAPGLWRNICPLAAANQTPRVLGFSRAGTPPEWLRKRSFVFASVLFFGIAGARLALFNNNASATGVLLSLTIINAFIAGLAFSGKSGWCSSMCPLLPCNASTARPRSSSWLTRTAIHACRAPPTASTSNRSPRSRPTCTAPTRNGAARATVRQRAARFRARLLHAGRPYGLIHRPPLRTPGVVRDREYRLVLRRIGRAAADRGDGHRHLRLRGHQHLLLVRVG